jgi:uncharacterized phage protein (TIGR02218 family)
MTYLTRPVFEFPIDWGNAKNKSFDYDLAEVSLGFGASYFTALQSGTIQGYRADVYLATPTEIDAFDDFFDALTGRVQGFWFPAPFLACQVTGGDDATHFFILDQNLRDTFAENPDVHLWITSPGLAPRTAKITAVAASTGGRERVTVNSAVTVTAADTVWRLHYVRLAADVEQGDFAKEGCQSRELRVVELPNEYTVYETGETKIYLYHFHCPEPMNWHWRYTSFAASVVSGNKLFTKFEMEHGQLKRTGKLDETLDITAKDDNSHPFSLFLPLPFSRTLSVDVYEATLADVETVTKIFSGQVRKVDDDGDRYVGRCDSWTTILARKFPRMLIAETCNYHVFDTRTCKAGRLRYETVAEVLSVQVDPPQLVVELSFPLGTRFDDWISEGYFAGGFLEVGTGNTFAVRTILTSVESDPGELTIKLNAPVAVAVGQRITLIAGCDGAAETCKTKFDNFVNFGGFVAVPEKNLTMTAIDAVTSQGGKK